TTGPNALRAEALFYNRDDLAGLIWEAEDRRDHPLLAYETARDFRRCQLGFRWRSGGLKALDAAHGPTLTIEGRNAGGEPRSWYVRLWNYAVGTPEDAEIAFDFGAVAGGWEGDDPVWAGDLDRMFVSLVAPDYDGTDVPLAAPAAGWAEMTGIRCDGSGSVLAIGDVLVPEHKLRIATGYDDLYHLTPARMLRNIVQLGYRTLIGHYVGMSHYFELEDGLVAGALNGPCAAWHADFLARAKAVGFGVILSLSYELLDQHCPEDWKQRAENGDPALTGWEPPSALLSPANAEAMNYLQGVARAFAALALAAGQPVRFQIGEPWWWVMPDKRICLYDDEAVAAFDPVSIPDVEAALDAAQRATLDDAGAALAASTDALCAAVRDEAPGAECLLLLYLPSVLGAAEVKRANAPLGWEAPAFDRLQLEDYDWVIEGRTGASGRGAAELAARLGYPIGAQHYYAGFVLQAEDGNLWTRIAAAADAAARRGTGEVFVWALPQVLRDGFVHFGEGEDQMLAFEDVRFPIGLGREVSAEPAFSTAIVTTAGGAEQRNSEWAEARLTFDAGPGLRSEEDLHDLLGFFRARRGAAVGFRLEDPFDNSSNGMIGEPGAADQALGMGDGVRTEFPLVKCYGAQVRRITRPVIGTVRVSVGGVERMSGWTLGEKGVVELDAAPEEGDAVSAGFRFDVPVRFAEDRLALNRATFAAGEMPSVPMIEVRE
ncbi:MAG TPA: DUF2460 domain-containing protein, partial [Allosphingosinicella sp.]|nr:DUF2460 domain-containing protein [Allosphingosinicella sp.]